MILIWAITGVRHRDQNRGFMSCSILERENAQPGVIAYRLLADLYSWFGFDAAEMPYVNRESHTPRIDPTQIR